MLYPLLVTTERGGPEYGGKSTSTLASSCKPYEVVIVATLPEWNYAERIKRTSKGKVGSAQSFSINEEGVRYVSDQSQTGTHVVSPGESRISYRHYDTWYGIQRINASLSYKRHDKWYCVWTSLSVHHEGDGN